MYLKERLIALSLYVFFLILIIIFIKKIKGIKITLNLYIIILSAMGYFYKPLDGADLTRILIAMDSYRYLNIMDIFEFSNKKIAPLSVLYYHFISIFNNDNLLPSITAFITFFFIFKIIKSFYGNYMTNKTSIALSLLFFMSRGLFLQTISNIRTMLSLSILAYCIYKILYEGKKMFTYLPLIIISSMMHVVGLAAALVFLFYYFVLSNNKDIVKNTIYLLLVFFIIAKYGKDNLFAAIELGNQYVESYRNGVGYFYFWEFLLSFLVIVFTQLIFIKYINKYIETPDRHGDLLQSHVYFLKFVKFLSVFNFILFLVEFNVGLRINYLLSILSIPLILCIMNSLKIDNKDKQNIRYYLIAFSAILMFISCTRGDLCGLKFS